MHLVHGLVALALDAEVDHGVGKGPAHVELQGQVVDSLEKRRNRELSCSNRVAFHGRTVT